MPRSDARSAQFEQPDHVTRQRRVGAIQIDECPVANRGDARPALALVTDQSHGMKLRPCFEICHQDETEADCPIR